FALALPATALRLEWLGAAFVSVIRLLVGPILFFAVVGSLARIGSLRRAGALTIKALLLFELLSLLALLTGMAAALWLQPGAGVHLAAAAAGPGAPTLRATVTAALLHNSLLQVLAAAIVTGGAIALAGPRAAPLLQLCERCAAGLFAVLRVLLLAAPLAAFGAIAFAVATYGAAAMLPLAKLLGCLYGASLWFILVALGALAAASGVRLGALVKRIKEELLLVVATASSTAAMPRLIDKLADAGCPRPLAGLVIPLGFSFNLNGSAIYIGLCLLFLAQACDIDLSAAQLAPVLAVAIVTSKAASGVAGSAFVTLAATLAAVPGIPPAALVYIVGIERLLKCRPLTNVIGNAVACLALCAWSGRLDRAALRAAGLASRP
ncbi:MAG: cation:dicarboxylate symporter family transporter, partial [Massilia sp.]